MNLFSDCLIGDTLMQTPAIRTWKTLYPDKPLTYYCGNSHASHALMSNNPNFDHFICRTEPPLDTTIVMDAAQAYNLGVGEWRGMQPHKSLAWGYGQMLGVEIDSLKYDYTMTPAEEMAGCLKLGDYGDKVVMIARHSASCASNDPNVRTANKCVSNRHWVQVAKWLLAEGYVPLAIGSKKDEQDGRYFEWPGPKLYGSDIRSIAAMCRYAEAVLTVDNGIRHLTAAAGGNLFCISGAIPLWLIHCEPVRDGQAILEDYRHLPHVTAGYLIEQIQQLLARRT